MPLRQAGRLFLSASVWCLWLGQRSRLRHCKHVRKDNHQVPLHTQKVQYFCSDREVPAHLVSLPDNTGQTHHCIRQTTGPRRSITLETGVCSMNLPREQGSRNLPNDAQLTVKWKRNLAWFRQAHICSMTKHSISTSALYHRKQIHYCDVSRLYVCYHLISVLWIYEHWARGVLNTSAHTLIFNTRQGCRYLKITSQTPLICHGDSVITELSAHPSHTTPERINIRNNQNTSPKPTGKHMLIPHGCLRHCSSTHLTSRNWFVIADLKIQDGGTWLCTWKDSHCTSEHR